MISVGSGAMGVCSSCLVPALGWHRSGDYWQDMRELGRGRDGFRAGWCVRDGCACRQRPYRLSEVASHDRDIVPEQVPLRVSKQQHKMQKIKKGWPIPPAPCLSEHFSFEIIPFKNPLVSGTFFGTPGPGPSPHLPLSTGCVPHNLAPNSTLSRSLAISEVLAPVSQPPGKALLPSFLHWRMSSSVP